MPQTLCAQVSRHWRDLLLGSPTTSRNIGHGSSGKERSARGIASGEAIQYGVVGKDDRSMQSRRAGREGRAQPLAVSNLIWWADPTATT